MTLDMNQVRRYGMSLGGNAKESLPRMRTVLQAGAARIKRDAQILAPVDTGNLRSSITYETDQLANSVRAEIGPTAEYALYVEEGTSTNAPQPFLGPAFDRNIAAIEAAAAQALEQGL